MVREVAERQDVITLLGEVFRQHGFSGTSLSQITLHTGLGKGSLYHFFPNGKKQMAEAVLDDVEEWFETHVFSNLRNSKNPKAGIKQMFADVDHYFCSGNRICLLGSFALDDTRDQFATRVNTYFTSWCEALADTLKRNGLTPKKATDTAEFTVASIQGALVLARSQDDPKVFTRVLKRLQNQLIG